MDNVISTVISFAVKGASAAATAIGGVNKAAGVCVHGLSTLASSLGSMGGTIGKVASQASNFMWSIQQMGALGGMTAGAQMAITQISNYFIEKADEMVEAVKRSGEKIRANLERINQARMDKVNAALDEATIKAEKAASAFEALASSYLKVQSAQNATASSGSKASMSALTLEKAQAMAGAASDGERSLIGASHDVRIAEVGARAAKDENDRKVQAARDEAEIRAKQATDATRKEDAAAIALSKAVSTYNEDVRTQNDGNIVKSKAKVEAAQNALDSARNDRVKKEAEAAAAEERIIQAQNERTAAINESTQRITEARETESRLIEAQKKSAQAEIERIKATQAAAEAERRKAADEARDSERQRISGSKNEYASRFNEAFDLWRDPEAAAAAVESDKKRSSDLKAFNKAVNRYGGKGKIDEYAALMRAGDEEGMQSRLDQWRKSSKFTPQVEQMVKAEAARQNENAAQKSLENIERNTGDLAKKIDELLKVK